MAFIAGKLLVASRTLRDPNFARTVVLMLEHSEEGALGVVLNRPSPKTVCEVWESLGEDLVDNDEFVYLGGPVPGPLVALHAIEELGEKRIIPGVYMSVQRDVIQQLVHTPDTRLRLYSGHSGWGGGQLEDELEAGGWHVTPAVTDDVFGDTEFDHLWNQVLERIAINIMLPGVSPDELPPDPSMN
ncbi:YqgE/AlgH family protein [Aeoliella sp.]|uniref:YqgE/AlgH family protein n=1 Tax=Aeoliella sp. TaxID=2795800 RepID=UPI003CCBACEF